MRSGWIVLALVLGAGFWTGPACAASEADYLALRNKQTLTPLTTLTKLTAQFPALAGKVIELSGTISGTFTRGDGAGCLLRVTSDQMVIVQSKIADADMAVGNTVRVLARIPQDGAVLEGLAVQVTKAGTAGDLIDMTDDANDDSMDVDRRPPTIYSTTPYKGPKKEPQPVFTDAVGLAQHPEVVSLYAAKIKQFNKRLGDATASTIAFHILEKSERYGIDPRLTMALVARESRFNPRAVSPAGALGLGQLMPGTAAGLGVNNPFDIPSNLDGTVQYIAAQLRTFGRLSLALAAYNAGPNAVRRYNDVPPYQETQNYVRLVWGTYAELAGLDPDTGEKIARK